MNKPALQQRLTQHSGLLDSQRQLLQRLLLQLEFNRPERLQLVGSSGSGKSTLMLALAEICSEHFNLALLQAEPGLKPVDMLKVMQQHWFGVQPLPRALPEFFAQLQPKESFLLLIDDADQLSDECWQLVQQLPVSVFISVLQPKAEVRLAMHLLPVTEQECRDLLLPYSLPERELLERIDDCAGDLHLLFVGLSRNPVKRQFKPAVKAAEAPAAKGFSSVEDDEAVPVFISSNDSPDPVGLRAMRTEQEQSLSFEAEVRPPRTAHAPVKASTASGQFFSPFLVMSIGFSLIAAVVMFWLWSEQQFRQPVAPDLVPYYPNTSANSTSEQRLASTAAVSKGPDVQDQLEQAKAVAGTEVGTISRPAFSDNAMPQMALPKTVTPATEKTELDNVVSEVQQTSVNAEKAPQQVASAAADEPAAVEVLPEPVADDTAQHEQPESTEAEPVVSKPEPEPTAQSVPETVAREQSKVVAQQPASPAQNDELLAEMAEENAVQPAQVTAAPAKAAALDEQVLLAMLPDTVAIQLGVYSQLSAAQNFINKYRNLNLQMYQRQQQGKNQFVVVSASYVNGTAARQQVKTLPEELRQQTPFVKSLTDIQREIRNFAGQ
ncbi:MULTISPECIES: SPOR domain-containing protein [Rheinheimera]|uniref:SPOR domain-containing protein n=1 Tax=Rheinheimera marina TaxID=1774958 RepID=A0ABV9JN00_9GAMM